MIPNELIKWKEDILSRNSLWIRYSTVLFNELKSNARKDQFLFKIIQLLFCYASVCNKMEVVKFFSTLI